MLHERGQAADGQIRPSGSDETRILPDHFIAVAAIARVGGGQIERHIARGGQFDTHLVFWHERRDWFLPGFRAVLLADVADVGESP